MRQILAALAAWLSTGAARARDENGATATEYAVLVAFIALIVAAGIAVFGIKLNVVYGSITESLSSLL